MQEEVQGFQKCQNIVQDRNSMEFQSQPIFNCFSEDSNVQSIKDDMKDSSVKFENSQKSKICLNKFCLTGQMNPNGKLVRMKIQGIYQNICQVCASAYKKGQFCCYCEQIYQETGLNADVDGRDWIGCDTCEKWVHIECEEENGLHQIRRLQQKSGYEYQCLTCRQKNKNYIKKNKKMGDQFFQQTSRARLNSGHEEPDKIYDDGIQLNNIYEHSFFRSSTFKKHLFSINEKKNITGNENSSNNNLELIYMQHSGGKKLFLTDNEYELDLQTLRLIQKKPFCQISQEKFINQEKTVSSQQDVIYDLFQSSENEECVKQKGKFQKNSTRIKKRQNNSQKGKKNEYKINGYNKSEEAQIQKELNINQNRQLRSKKP